MVFFFVVVDNREKNDRIAIACKGFELEDCDVKVSTLKYGDYLVDDLVVWEYKTVSDFMSSLYNESLFNEVFNQSEHYPFSFLVVQGDFNTYLYQSYFKNSKIKRRYSSVKEYINTQKKIIDGAIRRLRTVCNVVQFKTEAECLNEILEQSKKCIEFKGYGGVVRPSKDYHINPCKSSLMEISKVGDKLSDRIIEEFGLECLDDMGRITFDGLLSVKGVNEDIANGFWVRMYGCSFDEWLKCKRI